MISSPSPDLSYLCTSAIHTRHTLQCFRRARDRFSAQLHHQVAAATELKRNVATIEDAAAAAAALVEIAFDQLTR